MGLCGDNHTLIVVNRYNQCIHGGIHQRWWNTPIAKPNVFNVLCFVGGGIHQIISNGKFRANWMYPCKPNNINVLHVSWHCGMEAAIWTHMNDKTIRTNGAVKHGFDDDRIFTGAVHPSGSRGRIRIR